jgi:hypothetical protein
MAPPNKSKPAAPPAGTPLGQAGPPGQAAPTQTSGTETTLFLDINLGNGVTPMTAVYLPGPLPTGPLDLLVYFHGWKQGQLDGKTLNGMGADQFLTVPTFDFRKMIQGTTKRRFAFVLPTLGDKAGSGDLAKTGANIDSFLDLVLKGIGKHLPGATAAPALGNLVLAAHSGGGETVYALAKNATAATKGKIREVWCFDCTYAHGQDWVDLLTGSVPGSKPPTKLLPALDKLWVVSTGVFAATYKEPVDPKKPASADNPVVEKCKDTGTGDQAHTILSHAKKSGATNIEVYHAGLSHCADSKNKSKDGPKAEVNFTGYSYPSSHNKSVGENLPTLVTKSTVLK